MRVNRYVSKLSYYGRLLGSGDVTAAAEDARRWVWSDEDALVMARDLSVPFTPPPARLAFSVRVLDSATARDLFQTTGLEAVDQRELEQRRRLWNARLGIGYVAITEHGEPCYIQWAIPGTDADRVEQFFAGYFPRLQEHDLLLEGAWSHPRFRGQRLMSEAMSRITLAGAEATGARRALTVIDVRNERSLRGTEAAGFHAHAERRVSWRWGRRVVEWHPYSLTAAPR